MLTTKVALSGPYYYLLHIYKNLFELISFLSIQVSAAFDHKPPCEYDVAVIGGGPAGCTCALYTSRAKYKTVIIDKSPSIGALAITSKIANYPGVDTSTTGQDLLDAMREQAVSYGSEYLRAQVFGVELEGEYKMIYTPDQIVKARALVLATGAMGRKICFEGEEDFLGRGVSYCATCDGAFYQGQEIAVIGHETEAVEEAQFLTKFASKLHWITQTDPKKEKVSVAELLAKPNVQHWSKTKLLNIEGDEDGVTGMKVQRCNTNKVEKLAIRGVWIYMAGASPITNFLDGQNVDFKDDGGVKVDDNMSTSTPGVFAIGDIRNTPYKQVVVAAADGCVAAMSIDKFLKGRKHVRVDWIHK